MPKLDRPPSLLTLPKLDLLGYTRNTDKVRTRIYIDNRMAFDDNPQPLWIECGDIQVSKREREPVWTIAARMGFGITDYEEDSAYAFSFEAIGLEFESSYFGDFRFTGWISFEDGDTFRIPQPDYDPFKDPEGVRCSDKTCKAQAKKRGEEPHLMLKRFTPAPNPALFKMLKGKRFILTFGSYEPPEEA